MEVRNRDIPLLRSIVYIMQEVRAIEEKREWQRGRMFNITQHLSGMPGGGHNPTGLDAAFAAISQLEEQHKERVQEYVQKMKRADKIITNIISPSMRAFVILYYLEQFQATEVRKELCMTEYAFNRAKNAIESAEDMAHVAWHEKIFSEKPKIT